ncbi:MAG: C40 family peptidase, partial [bacterium]
TEARRELGQPYVWGGDSPAQGFDCSGFTSYVFRRLGVPLARTAVQQFQQGVDVERSALLPGDLVFFTGQGAPLHVGIYEGGGTFLNAPGTGKKIRSARLDSPYFARRFIGARRVTPSLDLERRLRTAASAPRPSPSPSPSPVF